MGRGGAVSAAVAVLTLSPATAFLLLPGTACCGACSCACGPGDMQGAQWSSWFLCPPHLCPSDRTLSSSLPGPSLQPSHGSLIHVSSAPAVRAVSRLTPSAHGLPALRCSATTTSAPRKPAGVRAFVRSVASRMAVQLALLVATVFVLVPSHSHAKASGAPLAGQAETALYAEVPAGSLGQQARRTVFVASAATNVADADSASDIGFNAQEAAEAALAFSESAGDDDTWAGWQRTTRKHLLEMAKKNAHGHGHGHGHDNNDATLFSVLLQPVQTAVNTLKLMFPLLMISVPICWVFPWELITGGYKDSTRFFRKDNLDRPRDKRARDNMLVATTIFDFLLSLSFSGGGGGHH